MFAVCNPAHELLRVVASGRNLETWDGRTISDATLLDRAELLALFIIPVDAPGAPWSAGRRAVGDGRVVVEWPTATLAYDTEAIPAAEIEAALWTALRTERDARLAAALAVLDRHRNQRDFGLPSTLTDEQATAWAVYAQALRDLPEHTGNPAAPEWPEAPSEEAV